MQILLVVLTVRSLNSAQMSRKNEQEYNTLKLLMGWKEHEQRGRVKLMKRKVPEGNGYETLP